MSIATTVGSLAWVVICVGADNAVAQTAAVSSTPATACARPSLPFAVNAAVWEALEASQAYRAMPAVAPLVVNKVENGLMKNGKFTSNNTTTVVRRIVPVTPCVSLKSESQTYTQVTTGPFFKQEVPAAGFTINEYSTLMGLVRLGYGNPTVGIATLAPDSLEIRGSLFPLKTGAQMRITTTNAKAPGEVNALNCTVTGSAAAASLDTRLKGLAWTISCQDEARPASEFVYLEDLGVRLDTIQETDPSVTPARRTIPKTGDTRSFRELNYTMATYSWR